MTAVPLRVVAQLRARQAGRAQLVAARRLMLVQPHAAIISLLRIAGDEATPHIVACSRQGRPTRVVAVAEPRNRDNFSVLIQRTFGWLPAYMLDVRDDPSAGFPQLIVPSEATARVLELLADRLRSTRGNAQLRRIGRFLTYLTERRHEPGQLALLTSTGIIAAHWVTGQDPASDQHLSAALAWLTPTSGLSLEEAVSQAESEIMGVNTDPLFDKDVLAPLLARYQEARAAGQYGPDLRAIRWRIKRELTPLVTLQVDRVREALALLADLDLSPLRDLAVAASVERDEFLYFMDQRESGTRIARSDRPRAAAVRFAARVAASEQAVASVEHGDPVARAGAVLKGRIVQGTVRNPVRKRLAPWRFSYRYDLETSQATMRARQGDLLKDIANPLRRVRVVAMQSTPSRRVLSLEIVRGTRKLGLPPDGDAMELAGSVPNWNEIGRHRQHAAAVIPTLPPTHGGPALPPPPIRPAPDDLVRHLESLR